MTDSLQLDIACKLFKLTQRVFIGMVTFIAD